MIEGITSERFRARARAALYDERLREALERSTRLFAERRRAAVAEVEDWEELREKAQRIREEVLRHLDHYLDQFGQRAEEAGAHVHWARTSAEACEIVTGIAKRIDAKRVVKTKSAVAEEIGLKAALAAAGFPPLETDLGEWIVQLAGESPSHLLVPAIHHSKEELGQVFGNAFEISPPEGEVALTRVARERLRREFARADLGITGVNFGIAETGSIVLVENQGNIRLATTLPRVHVAVMGIEKILPRFQHLAPFLRVLPRSASGQHLTSYQSILTGPSAIVGDEGPDELHIVLLDNGRSTLAGDPITRSSLACIRCGACLNACPVYREIGGHAYGSVYPGPIGSVLTPQLAGLDCARQLPFASSLCGACLEVCPVKIDIPELLLELRARVVGAQRRAEIEPDASHQQQNRVFTLWSWAVSSPKRYRWLSRIARTKSDLGTDEERADGLTTKLAPALIAWTAVRDLHPLAERTFREIWNDELDDSPPREERPVEDRLDDDDPLDDPLEDDDELDEQELI